MQKMSSGQWRKSMNSFALTLFIPILYFINLFFIYNMKNTISLPFFFLIAGLLLSLFGVIFWIISFYNLRKAFQVLPKKQKRVKAGLYKYFKHPMYIGISMTFLGLSLGFESLGGIIFFFVVMLPVLIIRGVNEEKLLYD